MRYQLQDLYDRGPDDKHLFLGFVERHSKCRNGHKRLLLRDLVLVEGGKPDTDAPVRLVTNHIWLPRPQALNRLGIEPGDMVIFNAKVAPYQKVGVKIDSSGEHDVTRQVRTPAQCQDYGLISIKNARKIPRLTE